MTDQDCFGNLPDSDQHQVDIVRKLKETLAYLVRFGKLPDSDTHTDPDLVDINKKLEEIFTCLGRLDTDSDQHQVDIVRQDMARQLKETLKYVDRFGKLPDSDTHTDPDLVDINKKLEETITCQDCFGNLPDSDQHLVDIVRQDMVRQLKETLTYVDRFGKLPDSDTHTDPDLVDINKKLEETLLCLGRLDTEFDQNSVDATNRDLIVIITTLRDLTATLKTLNPVCAHGADIMEKGIDVIETRIKFLNHFLDVSRKPIDAMQQTILMQSMFIRKLSKDYFTQRLGSLTSVPIEGSDEVWKCNTEWALYDSEHKDANFSRTQSAKPPPGFEACWIQCPGKWILKPNP